MRSFWRCISSGEEKTGSTTKTAKATWNGAVIAETDSYEVVEGNVYFPPSSPTCSMPSPAPRTPPALGRGRRRITPSKWTARRTRMLRGSTRRRNQLPTTSRITWPSGKE